MSALCHFSIHIYALFWFDFLVPVNDWRRHRHLVKILISNENMCSLPEQLRAAGTVGAFKANKNSFSLAFSVTLLFSSNSTFLF